MFFFFQAEDGIRDVAVTGVQTCALPISICRFPPLKVNPSPSCLSRFHRDLTRLRRLRLRYPDRQHPSLVSGGRLVEIEFIGKLDGTGELTERSFAPVVPCGVTDRLALALTLDCQGVTLSGEVEACWIHPGYLGHYHDSVPVIEYVHRGKVAGTRNAEPDCGIAQETLQFGLQREQITHRIEIGRKSQRCHTSLLTIEYSRKTSI